MTTAGRFTAASALAYKASGISAEPSRKLGDANAQARLSMIGKVASEPHALDS
jgi:hypothetical protein